jgi:Family of unknown function (DUF5693)
VQYLEPKTRFAAVILIVALLASLAVAFFRERTEAHARRVEIAMDYQDFIALARSYNYDPAAFLKALKAAGLTSLAVTEELGSSIGDDGRAYAVTGAQLANQARVSPIKDPLLAGLLRTKHLDLDAVYLLVSDASTFNRYRQQLPLLFMPKSVRVLRRHSPWIIEIRTQSDYFGTLAFGIPTDQIELARSLHLLLIPRFQNDERFAEPQIDDVFKNVLRYDPKVSSVIFFGLRNEVLGYPDHIEDAAAAFKKHAFNFGSIEAYDDSQVQKGNDSLAKLIPGRTVRVQAIAKAELDKIKLEEVVARFVLGVRERNVRIVYLRPWDHQDGNLSIEMTNVKMVHEIATQIVAAGYSLGKATPIPLYRGNNRVLVGIAALALPSIFVLLLGFFGVYRPWMALAAYGLTVALYGAGVGLHHDMFARSLIALGSALLFAIAAFLALIPAFNEAPAGTTGAQILRSAGWTVIAIAVALAGALAVVGIMSSPLAMEEIERFRGVRLVLAGAPMLALLFYLFSRRFASGIERPRDLLESPVLAYQLAVGIVIVAAGVLLVMRSGNDSDISPSQFELSLRHLLTAVLSVRPRFKLFLIGAPCMMLIAALIPAHRRFAGWLLALGAGVGIGDVIDTFSHLHTPLLISATRIGIGTVIGIAVGAAAIWVYRALLRRFALSTA